jgi:hypothetical protein
MGVACELIMGGGIDDFKDWEEKTTWDAHGSRPNPSGIRRIGLENSCPLKSY